MAFAGIAGWKPFYVRSRAVDVSGEVGSCAVSVSPIHKAWQGDELIDWRPGESLVVPDWRDAADLGAALVTAFRTATLDGRTDGK